MLLQIQNVPKSVVMGASASSSAVLEDVIKVTAGDNFAAVLKRNGDIFVWVTTLLVSLVMCQTELRKMYLYRYGTVNMYPENDTFIHNAVDVAIGGNSAAAIIQENKTTSDESGAVSNELANVVYTWGSNNSGQLGASKRRQFCKFTCKG